MLTFDFNSDLSFCRFSDPVGRGADVYARVVPGDVVQLEGEALLLLATGREASGLKDIMGETIDHQLAIINIKKTRFEANGNS
jgi:hypothetical protein